MDEDKTPLEQAREEAFERAQKRNKKDNNYEELLEKLIEIQSNPPPPPPVVEVRNKPTMLNYIVVAIAAVMVLVYVFDTIPYRDIVEAVVEHKEEIRKKDVKGSIEFAGKEVWGEHWSKQGLQDFTERQIEAFIAEKKLPYRKAVEPYCQQFESGVEECIEHYSEEAMKVMYQGLFKEEVKWNEQW